MSSEMAWRVSSFNAVWPTPWTKQPTPCALKVWQSLTHWVSDGGGLRSYSSAKVVCIHTVRWATGQAAVAVRVAPRRNPETPCGATQGRKRETAVAGDRAYGAFYAALRALGASGSCCPHFLKVSAITDEP